MGGWASPSPFAALPPKVGVGVWLTASSLATVGTDQAILAGPYAGAGHYAVISGMLYEPATVTGTANGIIWTAAGAPVADPRPDQIGYTGSADPPVAASNRFLDPFVINNPVVA